ncbi:hypothetical protein GCM10007919_51470 [Rhizobium indigoferae]|nr:hypothetical protein GCM10007919_51470 [Rhizobium indigoferae]
MGCSLLQGGFRRVSDLLRKVWVERRGTLPARLRRVAARSTVWPNLQNHIEQAQMGVGAPLSDGSSFGL